METVYIVCWCDSDDVTILWEELGIFQSKGAAEAILKHNMEQAKKMYPVRCYSEHCVVEYTLGNREYWVAKYELV